MELLIGVLVMVGILNLMLVTGIFLKLNYMNKKLNKMHKQTYENKLNIEKMVELLKILVKRTKTNSINFN